jgi:hypothetical protein
MLESEAENFPSDSNPTRTSGKSLAKFIATNEHFSISLIRIGSVYSNGSIFSGLFAFKLAGNPIA